MDYYNQIFDHPDKLPAVWIDQSFEKCTFKKLDLPSFPLSGSHFVDCRFEGCNLTRIELKNTKLYDVRFFNCQLPHVDFGSCNPFGFHVDFQECQLDYAAFVGCKLKKALFVDCSMRETHFIKCDLSGTVFRHCNLELAKFEGVTLTQVDFSSSYNLAIDPEDNKVKRAKFSLHNLPGLLTKYDLVICE